MKVSILIPNYNGEALLKKNLPKVIEAVEYYINRDQEAEIIIIDDASTDNSIKEVKDEKLKIKNHNLKLKVVQNDKNLGFSSAINRGAKEVEGEIMVLINTDVAPEKDFFMPLLKHFENEEVFAVGCLDKNIENGKVVFRGRGIGRWRRGFLFHSRGEVDKPNTLWVSGGSGAFRKSIWDKLGGFDELYNPFYWEDIDLSYRALKSGYKILFEPKSIVIHKHQEGVINKTYSSFKIKTIAYRNQFIFVWHNATDLNLQFLHILWLPYHLMKALIKRDWPFFLGFFQALMVFPRVIKSGFEMQKYFIKTDKQVMEMLKK